MDNGLYILKISKSKLGKMRDNDTIFELSIYSYADRAKACYPKFEVKCRRVILSNLASAEVVISYIVERSEDGDVWGFVVRELPLGMVFNTPHSALATYTYQADGQKISESLIPHPDITPYGEFTGRDEDQCPFKIGDFVECLNLQDMTVELHLVVDMPLDPGYVKRLFDYHKSLYLGVDPTLSEGFLIRHLAKDWYDDTYATINGADEELSYDNPIVVSLLPARNAIPEELKRKMLEV